MDESTLVDIHEILHLLYKNPSWTLDHAIDKLDLSDLYIQDVLQSLLEQIQFLEEDDQ